MSSHHHYGDSTSTARSEEDVDSAATTLLASAASSKAHSFDEPRGGTRKKYAELELEEWERKNSKPGALRGGGDGEEEVREGDVDREEGFGLGEGGYGRGRDEGGEEDQHLLGEETGILTGNPAAAETAIDVDGEQPPPAPPQPTPTTNEKKEEQPPTWSSLPKKSQLAILTLARLSEPLTQTSLMSYMFYQLKSFHAPSSPPPSDSTVARQAGMLAAAFTGAQFMTAIMWGRCADSERFGRKKVILIGLLGSTIGTLGFGFSTSFAAAVTWRVAGGMLNGNMGVMRTMISEMVREKRFQSRAFLLLPMTFNVGVIVGPLLGGLLADPVGSHPGYFSADYRGWMETWPYALPNVVNSSFLFMSFVAVFFGLDETLEALREKPDYGRRFTRWVWRTILRQKPTQAYASLANIESAADDIELHAGPPDERKASPPLRRKLPFRRLWTPNVLSTLLAHGLLAMHVGTFNNLWYVFLSTPRYTPGTHNGDGDSSTLHLPADYVPHAPFTFTGGLALPPPSIGTALAILGIVGISMQLVLYPRVSWRLGTLRSFRGSLVLFPVSYCLAPFLAVIPSTVKPPGQSSGFAVWAGITVVLVIQVLARTFALPSSAILINNSSPHPSVLGTVHGIAQTVSSATRTVGPALAGWVYGVGLSKGMVGLAWWCMAGVAVLGAIAARWVREGDGHEIWLEGEREEEDKG